MAKSLTQNLFYGGNRQGDGDFASEKMNKTDDWRPRNIEPAHSCVPVLIVTDLK